MKIIKFSGILFLFILPILMMSSCGQQETKQKSSQTLTNTLKAKINGKPYDAVHVSGFIPPNLNTLLLTGAMGTGEDIQLFLPKDIASGTYDFLKVQGKYQENDEQSGFAKSGALTITSHNTTRKNIKGTFYFTTKPLIEGDPSFNVTEGIFDITY
ncbi:DUF6252 family protein [uncultured Dokdonia sp.]|uniref:DUF6252 family protein n=1 Tax=uncultured Dokdonia sp. TaxID=575653 RepID=UPI002602B5B9|nr:DUF6252 family protein [uncultured Dokdonia sp.]